MIRGRASFSECALFYTPSTMRYNKFLLILFFFACLSESISSTTLSRQKAQRQAEQLLGKPVTDATMASSLRRLRSSKDKSPVSYLFNAKDGHGFVLLAAEEELADVLGYSMEHSFPEDGEMPCALALYLEAFRQSTEDYRSGRLQAPSKSTSVKNTEIIPLCSTTWGQGAPFNALCPKIDGRPCPSGCVATAMAQLMYYWHWPAQGKGYSWGKAPDGDLCQGTLEHTYNWDAMLPSTWENLQSPEAAEAVAVLVYDCGLSVNMTYNADGSGALTPIKALYTYFSYLPAPLRQHFRDCYDKSGWLELIREELSQGRVVFHTARSNINGGQDAMGHAFLVDGMDENDFVHVNWGWNGDFNGFFNTEKMNPGNHVYTIQQCITVGIQPNVNDVQGEYPIEYPYIRAELKCNKNGTINNSVSFNVTYGQISNPNANTHTWQFTVGLFNTNNEFLGEVKTGRLPSITLDPGYYIDKENVVTCKLNGGWPDGDYALRLLFHESGSEEWLLPDIYGGITKNAVYVRLSNANVTFTDGRDYIATGIMLPSIDTSSVLSSNLTRVYDTSGRLVYTAPSTQFNLWDVPAHGILVVKQGGKSRKVVR